MKVGHSRIAINPEVGHQLSGYGAGYFNTGVHDDVCITCSYFLDDSSSKKKVDLLFLVFDLVGLEIEMVDAIRNAISLKTSIPIENIFLHCTHTHSGPEVRSLKHRRSKAKDTTVPEYQNKLIVKSADVAKSAMIDVEECNLYYNFDKVSENINRRYFHQDGTESFIPICKNLIGMSNEYLDEELGIFAFRKKGTHNEYKTIITNYTAHPLTVGNTSNLVSADYQGVIRKVMEESLVNGQVLSTSGAIGDQHPKLPEAGFSESERMGGVLARVGISRLIDSVLAKDTHLRLAYKKITLEGREGPIETAYYVLGIGPIAFFGIPGELTSILGAQLKSSSPFLKSYILNLATDSIYYLSSRNQHVWGGYESRNSRIVAGQSEVLVNKILETAIELVDKKTIDYNHGSSNKFF